MSNALSEAFPIEQPDAVLLHETDHDTIMVTAEIITPAQFFPSALETPTAWTAERKIMLLAVLQDAVETFFRHRHSLIFRGRRLFHKTHDWLWSTDRSWGCSFENICAHLHLDAGYIRLGLKRHYDPLIVLSAPPVMQRRRFRPSGRHFAMVNRSLVKRKAV
jgi:hypothetical protein